MTPIVLVGEAYGENEALIKHPFVGSSGVELLRMLSEAGVLTLSAEDKDDIRRHWTAPSPAHAANDLAKVWYAHKEEIFPTNVFNLRPERNDIESLCSAKSESTNKLSAIKAGKYIRSEYLGEIDRLQRELSEHTPNVVVALGATAAWALLGTSGIARIRGTVALSTNSRYKVLPSFHPAAVLRDWSIRPVTVLDLAKAGRESKFREIRRPKRTIYIEPGLEDLDWFWREHLENARRISFDIETRGEQITCLGFAPSNAVAMVVPFTDDRKPGGSYWATKQEEVKAWQWVKKVCASNIPKLGQNLLYDVTFLWSKYGIPVNAVEDDTMLLHHSLQPESQKGLGFLGSVYTNEASWKLMRSRGKETIKRDE